MVCRLAEGRMVPLGRDVGTRRTSQAECRVAPEAGARSAITGAPARRPGRFAHQNTTGGLPPVQLLPGTVDPTSLEFRLWLP